MTDLIIFDCDSVLINSEELTIKKEPIRSLDISFTLFWQQSEIGFQSNLKKRT